jgi:hypothetical protein
MKSFLKKGRSLLEDSYPYKVVFNKQIEKKLKDHIQALNDLEKARKSGDVYNK